MSETKEWTVMFYFASDNPLAPSAVSQLKAIKDAGYHREANVIAHFDPHTVNTPAHIFEVNLINKLKNPGKSDVGFTDNNPFVRNLVSDKLWGAGEIRAKIQKAFEGSRPNTRYKPPRPPAKMSREQNPKDSLANFLDFCREHYPARHYLLFIMGHGLAVGDDLFLLDEHGATNSGDPARRSLLLADLGEVLDAFNEDIAEGDEPGQLELIGFHSCSMSGLEVAFELKGRANYMLASQGPAFVGSWPYRQILIRLFNDLDSSRQFTRQDVIGSAGLVDRLRAGTDPVARYLRSRFNGNAGELLKRQTNSQPPPPSLLGALVHEINGLLDDPQLAKVEQFQQVGLSATTRQLIARHQKKPFHHSELKRLNRRLIAEALPREIARINVKRMLAKIFDYCLYNSLDFQLAGYSFDLCLCDLNKVGDIQKPLKDFSLKLIKGLEHAKTDQLARDLILLAHWEAQSFFGEKYSDLYDFCFRLNTRLRKTTPASEKTKQITQEIGDACAELMKVLKRGVPGEDNGVIVRCEFAGPAYQYSHGLSIFFPWSEPSGSRMWDEQYERFKLTKRTAWREFLKKYFVETRRDPHADEKDKLDRRSKVSNLDRELLELFEEIATRVFNDEGRLKGGPGDAVGPGKGGGSDPTGSDCDCGSIKNYPSFTRARRNGKVPVSPNFFEEFSSE